jgi:hypothetical protein
MAYLMVILVKSPSPTNIQLINMIPALVGFPLADAPSTAKALPPSLGSLELCLLKAIYVMTNVNNGPITIQYLDGKRYANKLKTPKK